MVSDFRRRKSAAVPPYRRANRSARSGTTDTAPPPLAAPFLQARHPAPPQRAPRRDRKAPLPYSAGRDYPCRAAGSRLTHRRREGAGAGSGRLARRRRGRRGARSFKLEERARQRKAAIRVSTPARRTHGETPRTGRPRGYLGAEAPKRLFGFFFGGEKETPPAGGRTPASQACETDLA